MESGAGEMATFRMSYVKSYRDRHGKLRHYYRRPGYASVPLAGEPGSAAFAEAYEAAKATRAAKAGRAEPGSFDALIADYYASTKYRNLAQITQRTYRNVLRKFSEAFGEMAVRALTPKKLDAVLDSLAHKPGAQQTLRKVLRLVLKLGVRQGLIASSPMEGVRLPRKPVKGFTPWTEDDIATYEARWASGTRERLALYLCLYLVQRRGDVVTLGRQHMKAGRLHVAQSKSGGETRLWLAIDPALQAELDQVQAGQLTFLQTQYGKPFTPAGFTKWFRENARAAGLTDRTPHGLRKAGSRRLAEDGRTPSQIMAVTGHKNLSEVTLYTASADQTRLADEAILGTKSSNRGRP